MKIDKILDQLTKTSESYEKEKERKGIGRDEKGKGGRRE